MRIIDIFVLAYGVVFFVSFFVTVPGTVIVLAAIFFLGFSCFTIVACWRTPLKSLGQAFGKGQRPLFAFVVLIVLAIGIADRRMSHGGAALEQRGSEYLSTTKGAVIYRYPNASEFRKAVKTRRCFGSGAFFTLMILVAALYRSSITNVKPE